ncbi:unnamed protein product [Protopolystoma xenopodis]|uniref:Probable ribosome biogenesis protein RLP24 n=1 Tax=Protopolystoma xenopodis TaxID=117903 RepID=A0A448WYK8_9PLAT|nr:unnamed protein product [Protopolystoma xenopodis]
MTGPSDFHAMRIHKCWFCSSPIYPGHGIMFVRNDSKEFRFCRGKCHKAFKKKKNPRKVKWTKVYRKSHSKELSDDFVHAFERRKDSLFKYSREHMLKSIEALHRSNEIRAKREAAFIKKRLKKGIELRNQEDLELINTQMYLIQAPNARVRKAAEPKEVNVSFDTSEEVEDIEMEELEAEASKVKKAKALQKPKSIKRKKISIDA